VEELGEDFFARELCGWLGGGGGEVGVEGEQAVAVGGGGVGGELRGIGGGLGGGESFGEPLAGRGGGVVFDEHIGRGAGVAQAGDHIALEVFGEVGEVEAALVGKVGEGLFEKVVVERAAVRLEGALQGLGEACAQGVGADPFFGEEKALIEAAGLDPVEGEVTGDGGQVAAEEWDAEADRFEEAEAETLGDRGGDDVSGVAEPGFECGFGAGGGSEAVDDFEIDGKIGLEAEFFPVVVDRLPDGICGTEGDGEAGALRGEGGEEEDFAEVFAADAADGVEDGGLLIIDL